MQTTLTIETAVERLDYLVTEISVVLRVLAAVDRVQDDDPLLKHAYPMLHELLATHLGAASSILSKLARLTQTLV